MKKILFLLWFFLMAAPAAMAIPADPAPFKYVQPDGTVIVLQNHGDEFDHWTTDESGRVVEKGEDGYYRPIPTSLTLYRSLRATPRPRSKWSSYENAPETNFGDRKILCIIANFADSTFVVENPHQHFYDMLNKEGYDENGSIGSVRDYYIDNSRGLYRPQFDVFGPVNLPETSKYYDDKGAHLAIKKAFEMMAGQISIDDYDTDNDGKIDMVLFFYPGHNQAEGAGEESIWPHQSVGNFGKLGNKSFTRYFCTSELRGSSGSEVASIGTTCHEFAHSLGLPDFYDTDYEKSGGENKYTTHFLDLMSHGCYNDNGRKPPYLLAIERNMLGWMPNPPILGSGDCALKTVQNNEAYRVNGRWEGEYFILESRGNEKWDSGFKATGLAVYHVDKSERVIAEGVRARDVWETSKINAYYGHPCMQALLQRTPPTYKGHFFYPGQEKITTLVLKDWDDEWVGVTLSSISYSNEASTFRANITKSRSIFGFVRDAGGEPIQGAQITLTQSAYEFAAAPRLLSADGSCMSGADGSFSITVPDAGTQYQIITVRKDGFVPVSDTVLAQGPFTQKDLTMEKMDDGDPASVEITAYGVSYIQEKAGIPTVMPASGKVLKSVSWTLDGEPIQGDVPSTASLSAGSHCFMARLLYMDGTVERIYYDIDK